MHNWKIYIKFNAYHVAQNLSRPFRNHPNFCVNLHKNMLIIQKICKKINKNTDIIYKHIFLVKLMFVMC